MSIYRLVTDFRDLLSFSSTNHTCKFLLWVALLMMAGALKMFSLACVATVGVAMVGVAMVWAVIWLTEVFGIPPLKNWVPQEKTRWIVKKKIGNNDVLIKQELFVDSNNPTRQQKWIRTWYLGFSDTAPLLYIPRETRLMIYGDRPLSDEEAQSIAVHEGKDER